eukprot:1470360-Rhodomonas_salina.1
MARYGDTCRYSFSAICLRHVQYCPRALALLCPLAPNDMSSADLVFLHERPTRPLRDVRY